MVDAHTTDIFEQLFVLLRISDLADEDELVVRPICRRIPQLC